MAANDGKLRFENLAKTAGKQVSILKPIKSKDDDSFPDDADITPLTEGAKFDSYDALSRSIEVYCKQHGIKLFRSDSRTLRSAPNRANPIIAQLAPEQLIYYSLTYSCVYGGKSFKNFSKAKQPCKFFVRVNITRDYQQLEVAKLCDPGVHNHDREGMPTPPSSRVNAPRKRSNTTHIGRAIKQGKQSGKCGGGGVYVAPGTDHLRNVFNTLHSYQRKNLFCDTVILVKNGMLYAHSAVLAAVSPLLFNVLNQQPLSNRQPTVIDLSEYQMALVMEVLDFFYLGRVNMSNAFAIKELCSKLGVVLESDSETGLFPGESSPKKADESSESSTGKGDGAKDEKSKQQQSTGQNVGKSTKSKGESTKQKKAKNIDADLFKKKSADTEKAGRKSSKNSGVVGKKSSEQKNANIGKLKKEGKKSDDLLSQPEAEDSVSGSGFDADEDTNDAPLETGPAVRGRESLVQFRGFLKSLTEQPKYPCKQCCRVFKRETSLNVHMWKHWRSADGYSCPTCDLPFLSRSDLRKHSLVDHGQPLIAAHHCTVCGLKFLYRTRLWRHMTQHIDSTVYVCDACDRWHNVRDFSEEHKASHKYQRWWTCGRCGKRCVTCSERVRHELSCRSRKLCVVVERSRKDGDENAVSTGASEETGVTEDLKMDEGEISIEKSDQHPEGLNLELKESEKNTTEMKEKQISTIDIMNSLERETNIAKDPSDGEITPVSSAESNVEENVVKSCNDTKIDEPSMSADQQAEKQAESEDNNQDEGEVRVVSKEVEHNEDMEVDGDALVAAENKIDADTNNSEPPQNTDNCNISDNNK